MPRQNPAWHLHMPAAKRSSSRPCRREGKIAHRVDRARAPPALSRPTRSCSCPLFTSSLPMGPVPTSTRLTQGPFRLPSRCCVIRAKTDIIPSRQPEHREPQVSPPWTAFFKRVRWGKKIWPVATLALAAKLASGSFFFLLLSSCHVLVRTSPACWLRCRQGSVGPTVEHVGSLQCTPCLWLKAYTATSPVF